jgi:DNA-binding transcriptional MerR regulator
VYTVLMIDQNGFIPKQATLSLGRFAQAAGLTRKALRLYDQLEILVPDYVDPASGYRYYHPAQLEKARFIRLLREMEMPLADIRRVLSAETAEDAVMLVRQCQREFDSRALQVLLASKKVLTYLGKEKATMSVKVSVQTFPALRAVSLTKSITVEPFQEFIPEALRRLSSLIKEQGAVISGDPLCFYYGPVNQQDDGPVEICFPFSGQVQPEGDIQLREIPAHQGAIGKASREQSRFPAILEVWDDVESWVSKNKLALSDLSVPCYEIWHEEDSISVVQPFDPED